MVKTIAFVPVRGGSKSIPLKNIKIINGKPLVFWCLSELEKSKMIDEVVVATDSNEISHIVESFNFKKLNIYRRNIANSKDNSSTESVMLEYIHYSNINHNSIFLLVQATSPLVTCSDINKAISMVKEKKYDSILSCVKNKNFFWSENGEPINYNYLDRPRRQDFIGQYKENGALYANIVKNILKYNNRLSGRVGILEMPSYSDYEIDEPEDWIIVEELLKKYKVTDGIINANKIKLFITDVDGVLTDAGMYYSENGDELKKFNTKDGKGFEMLRERGINTGIITSENTNIVTDRAKKMKIDFLFQGIENKIDVVTELCKKLKIDFCDIAYVGDDLNDFTLLNSVGIAACPNDANEKIKSINNIIILNKKGGEGAVRELIDIILNKKHE